MVSTSKQVDTMDIPAPLPAQRRRQHSAEFKARIIAACRQPGVSIAAIAHANDLNDNMIRKWLHKADTLLPVASPTTGHATIESLSPPVRLVPVRVAEPAATQERILLELRRPDWSLTIDWPESQAATCVSFLHGVLR